MNEKVIEIKRITDIPQAIEDFTQGSESYVGVVLLAIDKEHGPRLITSSIENYQLSYLASFLNAHSHNLFRNHLPK